MRDLNEGRVKHIESFKRLIESLRAKANVFVSVMEVRLNYLLDEAKISTIYRHDLLEYFKNNGLLIVQGERKLMRYKFVEPIIKMDSEAMATKAYEVLSKTKMPKKQYRFKHQIIKDEIVVAEPVTMTASKDFGLKDKVVFMKNNYIIQGEIVSCQFGYKEEASGDDLPKLVMDFDTTIYDVMITNFVPDRGLIIKDINKSDIFSTLEMMWHSMSMKYTHSLKLVKAK